MANLFIPEAPVVALVLRAVTEQQMAALAGLPAERIAQRDDAAVRLLDRALTNAVQRYKWFVEELRLQSQCGRRAMVAQGPVAFAARE